MTSFIVDTNVPITANGGKEGDNNRPSISCRLACLKFLTEILSNGKIVLDLEGEIQAEYSRHLAPDGQPGVGDRFYQTILQSLPDRIVRVPLPKNNAGNYSDYPTTDCLSDFDPSDRKFVALAVKTKAPVANACDSDWLHHRSPLEDAGLVIRFVCGEDQNGWFQSE